MAKKKTTRRVPQASAPRMYGDGKPSQAAQVVTKAVPGPARPGSSGGASSGPRGVANLAQEYGYVVGDLKRLAIVASSLFALLVVVRFFIR